MAWIFRPTITRYTRDGKRVRSDTPGAVKSTEQSGVYHVGWKDLDTGDQHSVRVGRDRREAEDRLAEIEADLVRQRLGLPGPAPPLDGRPLLDHLAEYTAYLAAEGNVAAHVEAVRYQCSRLFELLQWTRLKQIRPDGVSEALAGLRADQAIELPEGQPEFTTREIATLLGIQEASVRALISRRTLERGEKAGRTRLYPRADVEALLTKRGRGLGLKTTNHYLRALKSFVGWLVDRDRIPRDPLGSLKLQNPEPDRRRQRRALEPVQFETFVQGVAEGPISKRLSGPDRLWLYLIAANTGFRAHELSVLTPQSFRLDKAPYQVEMPAKISKQRKENRQPIRADLAELLRPWLALKPAGQPLWPGRWWRKGAEMLRRDLERANIPFTERERNFDFHALRGQFLSGLAAAGIHPKIAQILGRLSSVDLVMKHYTDEGILDVQGALEKLPPVKGPPEEQNKPEI